MYLKDVLKPDDVIVHYMAWSDRLIVAIVTEVGDKSLKVAEGWLCEDWHSALMEDRNFVFQFHQFTARPVALSEQVDWRDENSNVDSRASRIEEHVLHGQDSDDDRVAYYLLPEGSPLARKINGHYRASIIAGKSL